MKERKRILVKKTTKPPPCVYECFAGLVVPAVLLERTPRAVLGPGANRFFSPSFLTWRSTWVVLPGHSSLPSALLPCCLHCSTENLQTGRQRLPRHERLRRAEERAAARAAVSSWPQSLSGPVGPSFSATQPPLCLVSAGPPSNSSSKWCQHILTGIFRHCTFSLLLQWVWE